MSDQAPIETKQPEAGPVPTIRLLRYEEVPNYFPHISARMITEACSLPSGPRRFKQGLVSLHEIEAWIIREEKKQGPRI